MPKKRPFGFIGSSTKGLDAAKAVQSELEYVAECIVWSQGVFGLSEGTLESLVKILGKLDFAVLVLTPDDLLYRNEESIPVPRDNVLLELGMFIGGLGRDRTFIVVNKEAKMHLPTDLAGITYAPFGNPESGTLRSAVGPACTTIAESLRKIGRKKDRLSVSIVGGYEVRRNQEAGIALEIVNDGEEQFPPYEIAITHPKCGTYIIFPSEKNGPLLPHQKRRHFCAVRTPDFIPGTNIPSKLPSFRTDGDGNQLSKKDEKDFALKLILEDSDKTLFQHNRIARAIVNIIRHYNDTGKFVDDYSFWRELDTDLPDEVHGQ